MRFLRGKIGTLENEKLFDGRLMEAPARQSDSVLASGLVKPEKDMLMARAFLFLGTSLGQLSLNFFEKAPKRVPERKAQLDPESQGTIGVCQ